MAEIIAPKGQSKGRSPKRQIRYNGSRPRGPARVVGAEARIAKDPARGWRPNAA